MGTIPVEGPTTTTGLQVVETVFAYDAFGLEPSAAAEPVYITAVAGPYGAELGKCSTQGCEAEDEAAMDAAVLVTDADYNAYDGWYFLRTTAGCYDPDSGDLKDDVYLWLQEVFCPVIPECAGVDEDPVLIMQGISQHPDASHVITFAGPAAEFEYGTDYQSLVYCATPCYDVANYNGETGWTTAGYDGATEYVEVEEGVDYDVGSGAGQFVIAVKQS